MPRQVRTTLAMWQFGKGYGKWGLMVGSVFDMVLSDVERAARLMSILDRAKRAKAEADARAVASAAIATAKG